MPQPPVPLDKVEAMFLAYCRKPTAESIARSCGVSWHTATKYIERGDPQRAVQPFRTRVRRVARLVARQTEERVAYSRSVALAATWDQLERFDDLIDRASDKLGERLDQAGPQAGGSLRLTDVAMSLKISAELKSRLQKLTEDPDAIQMAQTYGSGNPPPTGTPPSHSGSRLFAGKPNHAIALELAAPSGAGSPTPLLEPDDEEHGEASTPADLMPTDDMDLEDEDDDDEDLVVEVLTTKPTRKDGEPPRDAPALLRPHPRAAAQQDTLTPEPVPASSRPLGLAPTQSPTQPPTRPPTQPPTHPLERPTTPTNPPTSTGGTGVGRPRAPRRQAQDGTEGGGAGGGRFIVGGFTDGD